MDWLPIKTRKLLPPKDDLFSVFDESLTDVREGDILFVTSKVVAIHQGRCVLVSEVTDLDQLIEGEAEAYVERSKIPGAHIMLTRKHSTLIANAGIDESNGNGYFILWPENIIESAKEIWEYVRTKHGIRNFGVIITDSHVLPLRWGVTGISIGHFGFEPVVDLRGKNDLFGRKLTVTQQNIPDSLAAFGVSLMGESDERLPLLLLRDFSVIFTDQDTSKKLYISPEEDLYSPLLKVFTESKNKKKTNRA